MVYWLPGAHNLGYYYTKHHSPVHHRLMIPSYLHEAQPKIEGKETARSWKGVINLVIKMGLNNP